MELKSEVIVILIAVLTTIYAQDPCRTPDQLTGNCKLLLNCQTILTRYASDQSIESINYIIGTQTACGNRAEERVPYVCCRDGFKSISVLPLEQVASKAPQSVTTQGLETTRSPDVDTRGTSTGENCFTPDEVPGNCMSIYDCSSILEELKSKPEDKIFVRYIQQSNRICHNVDKAVCCPKGSNPILINVKKNEIN